MTTPTALQRELQSVLNRWRVRANVIRLDPRKGNVLELRRGGQRIGTVPIAGDGRTQTDERSAGTLGG